MHPLPFPLPLPLPLPFALPLLLGIAVPCYLALWFYRKGKAEAQDPDMDTRAGAGAGAGLFGLPSADWTLTPSCIGTRVVRDHVYANKTLRYPYHQTMAHQPMHVDHWIEPDRFYVYDLAYKARVLDTQGTVVCDVIDDPAVRLGCCELLTHLATYLAARFPNCFHLHPLAPGSGSGSGSIDNLITRESVRFGPGIDGTQALRGVSKLVQDDFLIASPNRDPKHQGKGGWLCAGGIVAFPGFYLLSDKIGRTLHDTHAPVPYFNERLLTSVERSLTRLKPDAPFERTSWELVQSDDLFWSPMAGPLPHPATPIHQHHSTPPPIRVEDLFLRLDHQTFVKMPQSGIVFFGVHPMRRRLAELRDSPLLPKLITRIHKESDEKLLEYKLAPMYRDTVIPYLEQMHADQIARGLITGDERPQDFRMYSISTGTVHPPKVNE